MSDVSVVHPIVRKPRHIGQKFALGCSIACALLMLPAAVGFYWFWTTHGLDDTWTPSMAAVTAFFGFCSVVLYATSVPQPHFPQADEKTSAAASSTVDPA